MATAQVVRDMGETIRSLLLAGVRPAIPNLTVELATADSFAGFQSPQDPVISVFLHRISLHPERRNAPPRRLPDGSMQRPLLPLELSFMITPWARRTSDEYLLIGLVLQTLYERAEVGPGRLQGNAWDPGDSVQLVLESLSTEDHYRVWDTVSLPYRLSLTYLARVIGIESRESVVSSPIATAQIGAGR
jgi:hypothetical protein